MPPQLRDDVLTRAEHAQDVPRSRSRLPPSAHECVRERPQRLQFDEPVICARADVESVRALHVCALLEQCPVRDHLLHDTGMRSVRRTPDSSPSR